MKHGIPIFWNQTKRTLKIITIRTLLAGLVILTLHSELIAQDEMYDTYEEKEASPSPQTEPGSPTVIEEQQNQAPLNIEDQAETNDTEMQKEEPFLFISHYLAIRYRELGLVYQFKLWKRWYLYDSENFLFKNSHVDVGFVDDLSPACNAVGGYVEIEPIVVLNMRFDFQQFTWFHLPISPSLGYFYFPDKNRVSEVDFSTSYRNSGKDKDGNEFSATNNYGFRFRTTIRVLAALWRFAFVDILEITYMYMPRVANENFWYNAIIDNLNRTEHDWFFNNYCFLFFIILGEDPQDNKLMFGAGWKYLWIEGTQIKNNRVGAGFYWEISDELWFMENPLWMVVILWHLDDPYKSTRNQGIPFIATTFSFNTNWY